jgi:hypothetical protein
MSATNADGAAFECRLLPARQDANPSSIDRSDVMTSPHIYMDDAVRVYWHPG